MRWAGVRGWGGLLGGGSTRLLPFPSSSFQQFSNFILCLNALILNPSLFNFGKSAGLWGVGKSSPLICSAHPLHTPACYRPAEIQLLPCGKHLGQTLPNFQPWHFPLKSGYFLPLSPRANILLPTPSGPHGRPRAEHRTVCPATPSACPVRATGATSHMWFGTFTFAVIKMT